MSSDAQRLPVRPRPLPDESFASWVQRTAFSNGLRTSDLYPAKPNVNKAQGLPPKAFMTENLIHLAFALGVKEIILEAPMQSEHVDATTLFCPRCLLESPYFRDSWRSPHTLRCEKHQLHLQEVCTHCNSDVAAYVSFKHRMHPQDMLRAFMACRKCGQPLHTCQAEPDLEPAMHWHLHSLLHGFQLEPPFPWLTVELAGKVWPVGALHVLYHQVVCRYGFHGTDLLAALWEGHPEFPQENPLGTYSRSRRKVIWRISLLCWFLEGWPWRMHRFLRHVAYATRPEERDSSWVVGVMGSFVMGHDPMDRFHLGYMQETLTWDLDRRHEDFKDYTKRVFSLSPFQDVLGSLHLWRLQELPVLNVEDCVCALRWKEMHFHSTYRQRKAEPEE
ncbi:TniQ family protein [Deinococcus roseus]|nr:TniQ family protein [Deinococcus roseus]